MRREIILLLHTHLTLNNIYRPRKLKIRKIVQTLFSKYYYQIYCCEDSNLETELRRQLYVQNDDAKDYVLYFLLYNEWVFLGIKRTTINHMRQRKIIHNFKNVISKEFLIRENAIVYNELLTSNIPQ